MKKATFEKRIVIQDREGCGKRLKCIHESFKTQAENHPTLVAIENMKYYPDFGVWFGYETNPGTGDTISMYFPETVLETSSKKMAKDKIMVIGIFVIKEALVNQLKDNEEYKNGNIYISTDTTRSDVVFDIYK